MAEAANPETGATGPLNVRDAAKRIAALGLFGEEGKPQPKTEKPPATEANAETQPEAKPKAAPETEPEPSAEPKPTPEGANVEEKPEDKEPEPETVELADTLEGLAEQFGVAPDQLAEHLKITVKIDGVEKQVNLKEYQSGIQLESDYRKKTAQAAETSRQAQEEMQRARAERQHIAQNIIPLIQNLSAMIQEEQAELNQYLDTDPQEYLRRKARIEARQTRLQQAQAEWTRQQQTQALEFQGLQRQAMDESQRRLLERFPEWRNLEKGREEMRSLRQYAKDRGVDARAAETFFEAPFFELLWESREYRKLQTGKVEAKKKLVGLPKVQAPGAAKPQVKPEVSALRVAKDRLRKTGHVRDAAAALKVVLQKRGVM